ncbi:MAG: hypothetical protein ABIH69_03645 [bacterium]
MRKNKVVVVVVLVGLAFVVGMNVGCGSSGGEAVEQAVATTTTSTTTTSVSSTTMPTATSSTSTSTSTTSSSTTSSTNVFLDVSTTTSTTLPMITTTSFGLTTTTVFFSPTTTIPGLTTTSTVSIPFGTTTSTIGVPMTTSTTTTTLPDIDDDAVIRDQLAIYEDGMRTEDVDMVMEVISDDYSLSTSSMGTVSTVNKEGYEESLNFSCDQYNVRSYTQELTAISIDGYNAEVLATIDQANDGQLGETADLTGTDVTGRAFKKFVMKREGMTWRITQDKLVRAGTFLTQPSTTAGPNMIAGGMTMKLSAANVFVFNIQAASFNDPEGNPVSFTNPFGINLVASFTAEAGAYSEGAMIEDDDGNVYSLTHEYEVE